MPPEVVEEKEEVKERKLVRVSFKDDHDEPKKWRYHFDPNNDRATTTVGDVKAAFAMMNGFYEDRIRFTHNGDVLDETLLLSDINGDCWEDCSNPSSSDSDSENGEGATLGASGGNNQDDREDDQREKADDESEKEQSKLVMKLFYEFYGKLPQKSNYDVHKLDKANKQQLQNQIVTVMRMHREKGEPYELPTAPEPAFVLEVEIQEAFTIAIITANDDVKYLSCRGEDTLEATKRRCANLFKCSSVDLELRKRQDSNVFHEGELNQSLNELGVVDGGALFASRKGRHKIRTLFGLCACMDIDVNMEKTARQLRRKIVTVAPDLMYVNFFMWYNGKFLSIDKKGPPLGDVIMGSSLLRVVIEMDFSIPHDVDTGPELRRRTDDEENRLRRKNVTPRLSSSSEKSENSQEKEKSLKHHEHLWFHVNKRALLNFDLIVECYQLKNVIIDGNGEATVKDSQTEEEPPISLTKLTHRMLFYELRQRIATACGEKRSRQILHRDGKLFDSADDRKTLDELKLTPNGSAVKTIAKEPSIMVMVKYRDDVIPMKVPGNLTSFGQLAKFLVDEKKVQITVDKIAFECNGLIVSDDVLFSECEVKNKDTITLVETFRVRVWQRMYIYDKDFWPHSHISEFKKWVKNESGIGVKKQVFVKIADDSIVSLNEPGKITLNHYGFKDIGEIEVFEEGDLPEELQAAAATGGGDAPPPFMESKESSDSSEADEDDPDYIQN